jgi:UDP-N-acetylglucosamine 4,6-dehydratase
VKKVIALSSDKAANPINLYGATKLCSDKLFVAANVYSGDHETKFSVVRYGNVMSSRGSVIPYFQQLVKEGKPIPITDKRMTRFWITLPQAAKFVMDNFARMGGGEIFVPKIPSMKIVDLARAIGGEDYSLFIMGIRPGEKIHEIMVSKDDARKTLEFDEYYEITPHDTTAHLSGFKTVPINFEYSSGDNSQWITVEELRKMIEAGGDQC